MNIENIEEAFKRGPRTALIVHSFLMCHNIRGTSLASVHVHPKKGGENHRGWQELRQGVIARPGAAPSINDYKVLAYNGCIRGVLWSIPNYKRAGPATPLRMLNLLLGFPIDQRVERKGECLAGSLTVIAYQLMVNENAARINELLAAASQKKDRTPKETS